MSGEGLATRLLELLDRDDMDAAIDAGLAGFDPDACGSLPAQARGRLQHARQQLLQAWAARDRHRARTARLERDAQALRDRRAAAAPATVSTGRPTLPSAAAAALARARRRARSSAD